ncbi:MAG: FAD-binding oxidoreductase [Gammaproteobacteria bacterium]|nr:FAD-binding oxidoreductase [Gammaproteobacteria bacterium]
MSAQTPVNGKDKGVAGELAAIVGESHCVRDPDTLKPWLEEPRGRYQGQAGLLVAPGTADETARVLACCSRLGVGVVPVGGRTGLCGGTHSRPDEVLLSLHRQRRVRRMDAGSMTAEAGCVLAALQEKAAKANCLFPLSLGSEGSCQLGGVLSTNAGGIHVLRYGMARELVMGLEVALPDGRLLLDLKPLSKDNAGYDIKQLFIGSEGTLGVITAATIKLYPRPNSWVTGLLGIASPRRAVALYRKAQAALGSELNAFELLSRHAVDLCEKHLPRVAAPAAIDAPWLLCVELAGAVEDEALSERFMAFLEDALKAGELLDAVCAATEAQREAIWRLRHGVPEAVRQSGCSLHHDLAVPPERIPEFLESARELCRKLMPDAEPAPFGHVGDGNLHYSISCPRGTEPESFIQQGESLSAALRELALAMDGSFSAEHGVGLLLKDELARLGDPVKLDVMCTIKHALDPQGIMNPGKVVSTP